MKSVFTIFETTHHNRQLKKFKRYHLHQPKNCPKFKKISLVTIM